MRVLLVTNMYPTAAHPYYGIFVSEQVEAVSRWHPDVHYDVYFIDGMSSKVNYLRSVVEIPDKISHGHYDVVHIHYGLSGLYTYWPFKRHVPTLVTMHGSDIMPNSGKPAFVAKVTRHAVKYADAAVVLNNTMEDIVKDIAKAVYRIPCAVNTELFVPAANKRQSATKHIVFPSNKNRWVKNYPLFSATINRLRQQYNIICEEHEIDNMTRHEISQLLAESHLLLLTSHSEGSPQVVKEAMSCNLPVVATPVGDVEYLLNGVKDCYVATRHDDIELASLAAQALAGSGSGVSGREKVFQLQIDEQSVADKIYDAYNCIINQ